MNDGNRDQHAERESDHTEDLLTDEQIESWRNVLVGILGPYALIMPEREVQAIRNYLQRKADQLQEQVNQDVKTKPTLRKTYPPV